MKTYHNIEEVKADIKDGVLKVDDDIEIAFNGFEIDADIICRNIYSKDYERNINAKNINAVNINAGNINADNINACDIKADNISYYAVCLAYKNIVCNNIEGRRDNAKHFCLDGKITIKPKEDDEVEKAIKLLEAKGRLKDGKILN